MPAVLQSKSLTLDSDRTLWATPPGLFRRLNAVFSFTLDVCAQPETAKVSRYYVRPSDCPLCGPATGGVHVVGCPNCDGLSQPWAPGRCWMNPPFGRGMPPWLEKAWKESQAGALVVALVPGDTSTRWYHDLVHGRASVYPLDGRVQFVPPTSAPDRPRTGANFGNLIAIYWPAGFWRGC